jgi:AraC-like DNA-binding protein/ligand-binding sensor protein
MNAPHTLPPISNAANDRDDEVVVRLKNSEIFREYQEAFETATGLPLVLRAVGSFDPPLRGSKQIASFCALMGGESKSCAACLRLQATMESETITESKTAECFAGLSESVVAVRIGEKVIGYLQTGQVLMRKPTEKAFNAAMAQLETWKKITDVGQLRTAYFETRVLPKARYGAVLRLLSSFAQHLSLLSNELMIKQTTAEAPAIAKARSFIAENLTEELSLDQVARAANTSPFYFCKIFKSATGLTFTDYVARARIERTKQLLLNAHTRISEAAYAAGFQSLSQFNRVFRRIVGQAPTDYRDRLHGSASATRAHSPLPFAA